MSPTLTNLGNDHEFIKKKIHLQWHEAFWEAQSKAMRAYAQSGHIVPLWGVVIPNIQRVYIVRGLQRKESSLD